MGWLLITQQLSIYFIPPSDTATFIDTLLSQIFISRKKTTDFEDKFNPELKFINNGFAVFF